MNRENNSVSTRHKSLREAETKADNLVKEIERRGLIRSGVSEKDLNDKVYELALELYGIKKYWHKRIVRAGKNTLCPYKENPPNLIINEDDILFFDFGPVFEDWEADIGRIYVLGNDHEKIHLKNETEKCWHIGKQFFLNNNNITGAELYAFVTALAKERGFDFPQPHCGHLIGNFPHEDLQGEELENYIHPENKISMRDPDKSGNPRDWILEVHLVNREKQIGGFFEQLLSVE